MAESKMKRLEILRDEINNLTLSPLYQPDSPYSLVFGEGSADAPVMFISTAPGKKEAEQGRPMVGPSGKILDSLLESINLRRSDVYITSIVKRYSPGHVPTEQEVALYAPFLDRQIDIIRPGVLAALGRTAASFLLRRFGVEQTEKPAEAQCAYGPICIFPLAHPAVALYNRHELDNLRHDFSRLGALLA